MLICEFLREKKKSSITRSKYIPPKYVFLFFVDSSQQYENGLLMNDSEKTYKLDLLADSMLSDKETDIDVLGFEPYVDSLSELIVTGGITPFTIGIFGTWGAGKTSLMLMLKKKLEPLEKVRTVWFNAWKFEDREQIWTALIQTILDQLELTRGQKAKKKIRELRDSIEYVQLFEFLGKSVISGTPDLDSLKKSFRFRENIQSISEFEKNFGELVCICGIERLVIFIDDLDRCRIDATVDILEAIRLLFNSEKCVYVLGLDYERVRDVVSEKFARDSQKTAECYLEKIFQLAFHIPRSTEEDMKLYLRYLFALKYLEKNNVRTFAEDIRKIKKDIDEGFQEILGKIEDVPMKDYKALTEHDLLIIKENDFNPRKLKRFLNIYELRRNISTARRLNLKNEYIIKFLLLQTKFVDFYKDLENNYNLLNEIMELIALPERKAEERFDEPELPARHYANIELRNFLKNVHFNRIDPRFYLSIAETTRVESIPEEEKLGEIVLRPHQRRTIDRIIERAKEAEKKGGLIWHASGSGKTYTLIATAQKFIEDPFFEDPTVLILVDRKCLEAQFLKSLFDAGIQHARLATSREHLKEFLAQDGRGIIVSTIQKFWNMPPNINTRRNIYVLVNEARTVGKRLDNDLKNSLPHAEHFRFTGGPVDMTFQGGGESSILGEYLDIYDFAESIKDGHAIPLYYTLAPKELRVDKETFEEVFLDAKETEEIKSLKGIQRTLEDFSKQKNILKTSERIGKVAEYIAGHFTEYIEPLGYKAFVVAVDREACALYKKELDKFFPEEYSRVVYSSKHDDLPELSKYHLTEEEKARVQRTFRKPDELPKILIVTQELLTGYDAPILCCIYLDKPMRNHALLQAIARVNRPYEDDKGRKKSSGLIVDFVGVFESIEKVLAFDPQDLDGVIEDIENLKIRFTALIEEAQKYTILIEKDTKDEPRKTVLNYFENLDRRLEYYRFFNKISGIYDLISPDISLKPHLENIKALAIIYRILKETYEPDIPFDKDFSKKMISFIKGEGTGN